MELDKPDRYLKIPRNALVALKRSIDPHQTDELRYEILKDDLDGFWLYVLQADDRGDDGDQESK